MTTPDATTRLAVQEAETTRRSARVRRWLLAVIGILYLLSVPWYRDSEAPMVLYFGLPDWVAVALGCYLAVAVLNGIAWLLTDVRDHVAGPTDAAGGPGDEAGRTRER